MLAENLANIHQIYPTAKFKMPFRKTLVLSTTMKGVYSDHDWIICARLISCDARLVFAPRDKQYGNSANYAHCTDGWTLGFPAV